MLSLQRRSFLPHKVAGGITSAMRKSILLLSSLSLVLLGAACSGGSGDGGGRADGGNAGGDGGIVGRDDASVFANDAGGGGLTDARVGADCAAVSDFGNLGTIDGQVFGDGAEYLSIDSTLDVGPPADLFIVELYNGFAPFANGLAAGTYEITGDQTDYNLCGACVGVFANLPDQQAPEMVYIAQSGTLVITSVEGNFAGSFTPSGATASFVGFSGDVNAGFTREDSCTVAGGGASWDKAIPNSPNQ
jgi:hypothetical protein